MSDWRWWKYETRVKHGGRMVMIIWSQCNRLINAELYIARTFTYLSNPEHRDNHVIQELRKNIGATRQWSLLAISAEVVLFFCRLKSVDIYAKTPLEFRLNTKLLPTACMMVHRLFGFRAGKGCGRYDGKWE